MKEVLRLEILCPEPHLSRGVGCELGKVLVLGLCSRLAILDCSGSFNHDKEPCHSSGVLLAGMSLPSGSESVALWGLTVTT